MHRTLPVPFRTVALTTAAAATLITGIAAPARAQQQPAPVDSGTHQPLFLKQDAWIAAGFTAATIALFPLDKHLAQEIRGKPQQYHFARNVATDVRLIAEPGAIIIGTGMYAVGRLAHQRDVADLGLHGLEAIVVGGAVSSVIKGIAGRARPYVSSEANGTFNPHDWRLGRGFGDTRYSSFPSGHTTAAFAAAAAVTSESRRWWPHQTWWVAPMMYGGATLVGLSRMYDNKHWATDVAMGAAIGTMAGLKVVRYHHHTNPNNRFDRWLLGATIVPDGHGGSALALVVSPLLR